MCQNATCDCELIELHRAARELAFISECDKRWKEAGGTTDYMPTVIDRKARKVSQAFHAVTMKHGRDGTALRTNNAGAYEGRMDAQALTPREIRNTLEMYA